MADKMSRGLDEIIADTVRTPPLLDGIILFCKQGLELTLVLSATADRDLAAVVVAAAVVEVPIAVHVPTIVKSSHETG